MGPVTRTTALFVLILCVGGAAEAASRNDLVVMVGYRAASDPYNVQVAAGIVVHQEGDRVVLVTAQHNLPERDPASRLFRDETIYVEFFSASGREFPAQILAEDDALELAVLELTGVDVEPQLFEAARHVLVPEGAEVVVEHGAFAVGNPNRLPWSQNEAPEPILGRVEGRGRVEYRFESSVADVGMSGGALFSEHGGLLGMVQTILGTEEGLLALGIETIARKLEEWKIPFSLEERPEVIRSASRRVLADLGLASAEGLRSALKEERPDFALLHLMWLAGLGAQEIETALGGRVEGSQASFASQVFDRLGRMEDCRLPGGGSSSLSPAQADLVLTDLRRLGKVVGAGDTCAGHMRLWVEGLLQGGLNPDLVVANQYYRREALLAIAMRSKNVPAMLALLDGGASPHPYQDLSGTEHPDTRLLDPLRFVLRDFAGAEQDALHSAFVSNGLVVSASTRSEAMAGLPATPTLAESETDPICGRAGERHGFSWCRYLHRMLPAIRFYTGTQECHHSGYCFATLTHTLFVGEERALLLADRHAYGRPETVVVEVSRKPGPWYAWERARTYGCIPRADGFEPSTCWRRYEAWPASYLSTEEKVEAERSKAALADSVLGDLEVEGISLVTPLPQALEILENAGYTTETAAAPGIILNMATTRDYTLRRGEETRQIKVIAMNDSIRALSFRIYGEAGTVTGFELPTASNTNFLFYETDKWKDGREVMVAEASGVGRSYLRYRASTTGLAPVEIDLLWRAKEETAPEQAFYERWLHEWLGQVEVAAGSHSPCIDRYAHLRGPQGNSCQTPEERAVSYLETLKSGVRVQQLPSGLSYEVLVEGDGPRPSRGSSILAYLVFKYLDGAREDDRINNWRIVVRDVQWPDVQEALLSMKGGAKWRVYVPPGIGSNDSRYLQLTEIHLITIGD